MGATPIFALNLVGFPRKTLPLELLARILEGGAAKATEAGIPIIGGHSIDDPEPKYGLVVVGRVHPDAILRNVGARPGDHLVLTKPLGSGVLTTALKRGLLDAAAITEVTELMATLNRAAGEVFARHIGAVHALTDVTGYGLIGHLLEMLDGSGVAARLDVATVPVLPAARRFAADGVVPGGSKRNLAALVDRIVCRSQAGADPLTQLLFADAQTSGGLLAAVDPTAVEAVCADLRAANAPVVAVIGEIIASHPHVLLG